MEHLNNQSLESKEVYKDFFCGENNINPTTLHT